MDFYLFSYNTGTANDFSNQETIADLSVLSPISVHDNTVSFPLKSNFLVTFIKDKYILDIISKGVISNNTINTERCVIPTKRSTSSINGITLNNNLIIYGLFGDINSTTIWDITETRIKLIGGALDDVSGPSFYNCIISAEEIIFTSTDSLSNCDIRASGKITIGKKLEKSIVRVTGDDCELTGETISSDANDKLIYGRDGVVKVLDPFTLAT